MKKIIPAIFSIIIITIVAAASSNGNNQSQSEAYVSDEIELISESETDPPTTIATPENSIDDSIPEEIEKKIIVTQTEGALASLSAYTISSGDIVTERSCLAYIGKNGVSFDRTEGDKTTPGGLFSLGMVFGNQPDPGGLSLPYTQIQAGDYWVGDSSSKYYNQWRNVNDEDKDWSESLSENLIKYGTAYNYCIEIRFNAPPDTVAGKGSAIFLHCYSPTAYTSGCIAIPEEEMLWLLRFIDDSTTIEIR